MANQKAEPTVTLPITTHVTATSSGVNVEYTLPSYHSATVWCRLVKGTQSGLMVTTQRETTIDIREGYVI